MENLTRRIVRMSTAAHWVMDLATLGMFPALWFAWARDVLDGLVPGKRIPVWGPVTAYLCWLLGSLSLVLAFHPESATGFDLMRAFGLEQGTMLEVGTALWLVGRVVVAIMSNRAMTILKAYYDQRLAGATTISRYLVVTLGSTYVQYMLNMLSGFHAMQLRNQAAAARRSVAIRCLGR